MYVRREWTRERWGLDPHREKRAGPLVHRDKECKARAPAGRGAGEPAMTCDAGFELRLVRIRILLIIGRGEKKKDEGEDKQMG